MSCTNISTTMSDCLIYWKDILGQPCESSTLDEFVNGKIDIAKTDLLEVIGNEIDLLAEKITNDIKDGFLGGDIEVDPYTVKYKDSTVGDTLDAILDEEFAGSITPELVYEKGRDVKGQVISWSFNRPVTKLSIIISSASSNTTKVNLDPSVRTYDIGSLSDTSNITVTGVSEEGTILNLTTKVTFKMRMYYGTYEKEDLTNEEILALNSILIDFEDKKFTHLLNCQGGQYIHYLFPNNLHTYYNFYTNGMKDHSYVWEIEKVTNQYGYVENYIRFRTPFALTGCDIRSEVCAHETY